MPCLPVTRKHSPPLTIRQPCRQKRSPNDPSQPLPKRKARVGKLRHPRLRHRRYKHGVPTLPSAILGPPGHLCDRAGKPTNLSQSAHGASGVGRPSDKREGPWPFGYVPSLVVAILAEAATLG